jgi:hypothetical protein
LLDRLAHENPALNDIVTLDAEFAHSCGIYGLKCTGGRVSGKGHLARHPLRKTEPPYYGRYPWPTASRKRWPVRSFGHRYIILPLDT